MVEFGAAHSDNHPMNEAKSKPVVSVMGPKDSAGRMRKRRQVYSNRPLAVYGYIVPLEGPKLWFAIQVGDSFTPLDAPHTETGFRTVIAATRAILAYYPDR